MKKTPYYLTGIFLILILWLFLSFYLSNEIVPYPWEVIKNIFFTLLGIDIYKNLLITIIRSLIGFSLACITGTVIGIITGSFKSIEKTLFIPIVLLQGAPPILWIIPLMLIFGTGGTSPIAVVFFVVLPLVLINIQEGTKAINKEKWEMFRIYANSKILKLKQLILPSLSSSFKSILILGVMLALKSSVVGEWFGAKNGIGRLINEYFYTFDIPSFYSAALIFLIIVSVIGYLTGKAVNNFFKRKKTSIIGLKKNRAPDVNKNKINSLLTIKDLNFSYGKDNVLRNINFNLRSPKTIVLTGESGCGKTTFAKIAVGLLKPQKGKIALPDNPCLIFQDDIFLDHLDCFGNALLPAKWKKVDNPEQETFNILEKCGLKAYMNYFPDQISGGMKKRLTFARAFMLNPDFIILDEPFINLHKEARVKLWNLYFELFVSREIPSIIITHYPEELKNRNVEFYEIKNGEIKKK